MAFDLTYENLLATVKYAMETVVHEAAINVRVGERSSLLDHCTKSDLMIKSNDMTKMKKITSLQSKYWSTGNA
ncbi:hypothetical protein BDW60DRAFT_207422 [Aspergillus nidulans var. acristatus]